MAEPNQPNEAPPPLLPADGRVQALERLGGLGSFAVNLPSWRMSPGCFALFGQPPTASGEPAFDPIAAVHEADRARVLAALAGAEAGLAFRLVRPGGEVRYLRGELARQEDGSLAGTLVDVTASEELPRLRDELLAIVGHELRTPLTAILMPLQLLGHGVLDPQSEPGARMLHLALQNAERLTRLVQDATLFERLAGGELALRLAQHSSKTVATGALDVARLQAEASGIQLELAAEEPVAIKVDADRLQVALEHLLENAIALGPAGSTVTLTVRAVGPRVCFEVQDQGPGVPPALREAIFEPLRQADSSLLRRHRGLGLGLALASRVARAHGGELWHEEPAGGGSRFVLAVPRGQGSQTV